MRGMVFCLTVFLLFTAFFPSAGMGEVITLQAGNVDAFAAPADPASPSSALADWYGGSSSRIDFDVFLKNRAVLHTFTNLPSNIVAGTLEFHVKALGEGHPDTDAVGLLFADGETLGWDDGLVWGSGLGPLKENLGLGSGWVFNEDHIFTLSLSALPLGGGATFDILPELNQHQFLDMVVQDDTAVDYFKLTLVTVPEPSFLVTGSGLFLTGMGICGWRRRKRKA